MHENNPPLGGVELLLVAGIAAEWRDKSMLSSLQIFSPFPPQLCAVLCM